MTITSYSSGGTPAVSHLESNDQSVRGNCCGRIYTWLPSCATVKDSFYKTASIAWIYLVTILKLAAVAVVGMQIASVSPHLAPPFQLIMGMHVTAQMKKMLENLEKT